MREVGLWGNNLAVTTPTHRMLLLSLEFLPHNPIVPIATYIHGVADNVL